MAPTSSLALQKWVEEVASLTNPSQIHWCDGSISEYENLVAQMLETKELLPLSAKLPRSYLHRSASNDVARTEHLTFICTSNKEDTGPNNNWMSPSAAHQKIDALFKDCMKGRTLYVVPYCMGPIDSPYARVGVEITDSAYVVANMRLMTRMGTQALKLIEKTDKFVRGLHSVGDLSLERRFIMHFPDELMIKSIGSGYGGNALLGKKCHALRIGSYQALQEGWLAEHMLILGIENPQGEKFYIAAAFPSACGKTNLAMLIPPKSYDGWKITTVGDDIAWLHLGSDGRIYGINPEAGYFGVAPGTSKTSNPNALSTLTHDTIFTNVALTADNEPWWEGLDERTPVYDWQGRPYDPKNGPAAQPNSRFTVSAKQCPSYSPEAENPNGVPISAIIFGGRRPSLVPLVTQAKSWAHGVLMGASVASETTAAATGQLGVLRHDPMAMKPFCGYNFADYWQHWLSFAERSNKLPLIFNVNWFRQDENKRYIWPGFGENIRVLEWITKRIKGQIQAQETPIGHIPEPSAINVSGLNIAPETMVKLFAIDYEGFKRECSETRSYLAQYGARLPSSFLAILSEIEKQLEDGEQKKKPKSPLAEFSPLATYDK